MLQVKRIWWIPALLLAGLEMWNIVSGAQSRAVVEAARQCSVSQGETGTPRARLEQLTPSCSAVFLDKNCREAVRTAADTPPALVFQRLLQACQPTYCAALSQHAGGECAPAPFADPEKQWSQLSLLAHVVDSSGVDWRDAEGPMKEAHRALAEGLATYAHPPDLRLRTRYLPRSEVELEIRDVEGTQLLVCPLVGSERAPLDECLNQLDPKRFLDAGVELSTHPELQFGFMKALEASLDERGIRDVSFATWRAQKK